MLFTSISLGDATAAITAIGGLGTAAFGLVDATKAFDGGMSNFGFGHVKKALQPFASALRVANSDWLLTIRANWINGMAKDDQKTAAKSLVRLGLNSKNAAAMAAAGRVDPAQLTAIVTAIETGGALTPADANVLGRFNAAIDAAMDTGFERGDQQYRNACRLAAGVIAVALSIAASVLQHHRWALHDIAVAVLIGLVATPLAPVAKDIASSLQTAASAVQPVKK